VRRLLDEWQDAGTHELRWDGRDPNGAYAAAGLYFARVMAGEENATVRVVRVR
jgi:hypothetical protein